MVNVDIEAFQEAILACSEVEIDFTELIQNIHVNGDGNFESTGGGVHVILSPEYEVIMMAGGVSQKASDTIMNDKEECDM